MKSENLDDTYILNSKKTGRPVEPCADLFNKMGQEAPEVPEKLLEEYKPIAPTAIPRLNSTF